METVTFASFVRRIAAILLVLPAVMTGAPAKAVPCSGAVAVCSIPGPGGFALIKAGNPAAVFTDDGANDAVQMAADSFAGDLKRVSGKTAARVTALDGVHGAVVIIGVLGQSKTIDDLVKNGKIAAGDIAGQWEAFRQIVVANPFPGIDHALVIVGSDRRGAVFGTYDISEKIGVSPNYWFADVPVKARANVYLTAGSRMDAPKVKYRGIFINDEAPAFETWTKKKFGGANAKAYAPIFELILRLKGNYLWPAMWPPRAFNDDDPQNYILADKMGVVMGTSHHEPMMRAHDEWHRNMGAGVTGGKWDYATNAANLRSFWRGGIERMMGKGTGEPYESLVTVGMRGDGDEPMSESTATQLLETIVADQRKIIADVTGKPAEQTPQVWALYKEVQDYYDHGMTVPDDVILLFADDNWGQNRRLPVRDLNRKGGYGVYYHFDYVGAPRNYKWLNTNQVEKTWQQMDLAYQRGAKALWVVNVGDVKPMEYPIDFFLRMAWNPEAMNLSALKAYPDAWARDTFGPVQAKAIANIVSRYSQLAALRKPELLDATTYPLGEGTGKALNGGVFGEKIAAWTALVRQTEAVKAKLPKEAHDAYFELVEHPVLAMANLYSLYYAVAWNRRLAEAGDARANAFADQAEALFRRDQELSDRYHQIAGGKWDGMMLQTHIGYTIWQSPPQNIMPEVKRVAGKAVKPVFAKPVVKSNAIIIEAPRYSRAIGGKGLNWQTVPYLGRTGDGVIAMPQGEAATTQSDGVHLQYDVTLRKAGDVTVAINLSPTLDTIGKGNVQLGVSIDDQPMQKLAFNLIPAPNDALTADQKAWVAAVIDNTHVVTAAFKGLSGGKHTVKIWRLDDNVVLQRLTVSRQ